MRTDDCMAAVHVALLVEKMHRPAEALRTAGRFAKKLGHARVGAGSTRQCVTMIAVSRNDVIVVPHGCDRADHDSLLSDVKMTEATDLLRLILLARAFLETPNQQHQREHLDLVALLGPLHRSLRDARQCGSSMPAGFSPKVHAHYEQPGEKQIA